MVYFAFPQSSATGIDSYGRKPCFWIGFVPESRHGVVRSDESMLSYIINFMHVIEY